MNNRNMLCLFGALLAFGTVQISCEENEESQSDEDKLDTGTGDEHGRDTGERSVDRQGLDKEAYMNLVEGRYTHFDVVAYEETVDPVGEIRTLVISYGFTDFDIVEGELHTTQRFCRSAHRSNQPFETHVSDAFTQAIVPESTPVTLTLVDGEWAIFRPETPTFLGIKIDDPNEPLPTDPNDPRISDDDDDGHPGVTVSLVLYETIEADLYLARREIFAYDLQRQEDGGFLGQVHDRSEQLVLGATHPMLDRPSNPKQYEDLTQSPIVLTPIDRSYDCDRLIEEIDQLMPPIPEVW